MALAQMQTMIFCFIFAEGGRRYALKIDKKIYSYRSIANLVRQLIKKEEAFFQKKRKESIACSATMFRKVQESERIVCRNLNAAEINEFWQKYKEARK